MVDLNKQQHNPALVGSQPSIEQAESAAILALPEALSAKYEVLCELGRGASASVFKARHRLTEQMVAIKILHTQSASTLKRFRQEAALACKLAHPNIVTVHDFNIADDVAYLVMEYVEGPTLSSVLASNGPIETERFKRIVADLCQATQYAHELGVVHRDIKPSNILLATVGQREVAKIADFGIARSMEQQPQSLTQTGEIMGTPLYMSPEQCMGQTANARSDIYALGCVMYEMVTGEPPLAGDNFLETVHRRVHEQLPRFGQKFGLAANIEETITRCLSKAPEDRFSRPSDIAAAVNGGRPRVDSWFARKVGRRVALWAAGMTMLLFLGAAVRVVPVVMRHDFSKHKGAAAYLPDVRTTLYEVAIEAERANRLKLAEAAFTKLAGMDHQGSNGWKAGALEHLAIIHRTNHDIAGAKVLTEQAAEIWRAQYGDNSSYSAYADITAGNLYMSIGEPNDAQRHFDRALNTLLNAPADANFRTQRNSLVGSYKLLAKQSPSNSSPSKLESLLVKN